MILFIKSHGFNYFVFEILSKLKGFDRNLKFKYKLNQINFIFNDSKYYLMYFKHKN